MDMDWDQIATVAQLVTGVATLAVAVLLVSQLRQQHRDSEREILYTSQGRMQDLQRTIMTADFGPIWARGSQDFDSLTTEEQQQFRALCYSMLTLQSVNAQSGHEGLDRGVASRIQAQTTGAYKQWPGIATYYERYGRSHTYNPDLRALLDEVFLEQFGREVDTRWEWGVRESAS
tara:strand:- start:605 stop:1129 length:525 start_codon:yes stop_codon:yes gene_type:complete